MTEWLLTTRWDKTVILELVSWDWRMFDHVTLTLPLIGGRCSWCCCW